MENESRLIPWVAAEARINHLLIHVERYLLMLTTLLTGFDEIDSDFMENARMTRRWLRTYLDHTSVSILYTLPSPFTDPLS